MQTTVLTVEQLEQALGKALMLIENLQKEIHKLRSGYSLCIRLNYTNLYPPTNKAPYL